MTDVPNAPSDIYTFIRRCDHAASSHDKLREFIDRLAHWDMDDPRRQEMWLLIHGAMRDAFSAGMALTYHEE